MTPSPRSIIYTMRELKRHNVRLYGMDLEALDFIRENRLMEEVNWPASFIRFTNAGINYIQENSDVTESDGD